MKAFMEFSQEELRKATSELVQQLNDGHKLFTSFCFSSCSECNWCILRRQTVPVILGVRDFPGHESFSLKIWKVLSKVGWVHYLTSLLSVRRWLPQLQTVSPRKQTIFSYTFLSLRKKWYFFWNPSRLSLISLTSTLSPKKNVIILYPLGLGTLGPEFTLNPAYMEEGRNGLWVGNS